MQGATVASGPLSDVYGGFENILLINVLKRSWTNYKKIGRKYIKIKVFYICFQQNTSNHLKAKTK
jgi:hypothetical protein